MWSLYSPLWAEQRNRRPLISSSSAMSSTRFRAMFKPRLMSCIHRNCVTSKINLHFLSLAELRDKSIPSDIGIVAFRVP